MYTALECLWLNHHHHRRRKKTLSVEESTYNLSEWWVRSRLRKTRCVEAWGLYIIGLFVSAAKATRIEKLTLNRAQEQA